MALIEAVYAVTDRLPDSERFGLVIQMNRSAISIASNIAEGYSRSHTGDYLKHLSYARGSLAELETQMIAAVRTRRVERHTAIPAWNLSQEVGKMLTSLICKISVSSTSD